MKKPTPRKPLGQPPHPLAGFYIDTTGKRYCVPAKPEFALFRQDADGNLVDANSPIQNKPDEFRASLAFGTFTKLV